MDTPTPPLAPRIPGRIRMPVPRLVGTLIILVIPIMAAWGILGKATAKKTIESGTFRAELRYAARLHYQEQSEIVVRVENRAPSPITAVITFAPGLIEGFSDVTFSPSEEKAYVVRLAAIEPGTKATARVSMRGDGYGLHTGRVDVVGGGGVASASLNMFVFP